LGIAHAVEVGRRAVHDEVGEVPVEGRHAFADLGVIPPLLIIPIDLRQRNNQIRLPNILNKLVRRLTQIQQLPRQIYPHHTLKIERQRNLKLLLCHAPLEEDFPLLVVLVDPAV
jgi:hypothetical protein